MPKNKDAYSRYKIIDQYLRQVEFSKSSRLSEICSDKLGIPISIRTIQKDIQDLIEDSALQIYAPIKYSNKQKAYYYPENVDDIFPAIELNDEEISALLFYGMVNNQYNSLGIFQEISSAIEKVLNSANIKTNIKETETGTPLILTEKTLPLKGSELLIKILQALKQKRQIIFEYHKFGGEVKERTISPYLLKEDKHMWYVIGFYEKRENIITFAVDRMSKVRILDKPIIRNHFNPDNYFKYSFGITVPEEKPIEIILLFTQYQGHYIKTLPIHDTQKILSDNNEGLKISIMVKPTYEFYSKVLSYGNDVKIIDPQSIAIELKSKIEDALKLYLK
ncbi:helix-turn-helix transcriptional regulator [Brumimicrobium mesophilum]|uniref:helix-turn-helix transcriptional regulator n=1 Tax=Brumimicrobium mesophilum TaxID=392717 RepID=UPI000D142BCE|nr:WYL domain-containing protein [Brumimicrobium mesophilum]